VSPRPTTIHQVVAGRLYGVLSGACPEDLCVVPDPAVELGAQTEFDPDLAAVRMDQIGGAKFTEPPLLVVEIRSPSTALIDLKWTARQLRVWLILVPLPGRHDRVRGQADRRDLQRALDGVEKLLRGNMHSRVQLNMHSVLPADQQRPARRLTASCRQRMQ
jgi:Putative restriction endonuclease